MLVKFTKTTANICFYTLLAMYCLSVINITLANEWGLEKQKPEHDTCDSIILHYDGEVWSTVYHGFNMGLNDIFGFDDNDIFAIGKHGTILHYNGKSWEEQKSRITSKLTQIWGKSRNNIYIVGDHGTILHLVRYMR